MKWLHPVLLWLLAVGCGSSTPPMQAPSEPSARWGTAHPVTVEEVDPAGRWMVICQARSDTNGDGRVASSFGRHGEHYGDRLLPYLLLAPGEGEPIERFVAADEAGDRLVIVDDARIWLVDVESGARGSEHGAPKRGRARPGGAPSAPQGRAGPC